MRKGTVTLGPLSLILPVSQSGARAQVSHSTGTTHSGCRREKGNLTSCTNTGKWNWNWKVILLGALLLLHTCRIPDSMLSALHMI